MRNSRLELLTDYPFQRLASLLRDIDPLAEPLILSIGEPQTQPPDFVLPLLAAEATGWGKYPPMNGTLAFRAAAAGWASRRYALPDGALDPERHLLPLCGSREGLFQVAQLVLGDDRVRHKSLVLLPNPFYQVYAGAAILAGGQPVFVPAAAESGFLPDFSALPADILDRTALAYFCSPANPQGSVADAAQLARLVRLARQHDFVLAMDECYSEIYHREAPAGALAVAAETDFDRLLCFHSLSKRSSVPGFRSGFVAGDADLLRDLGRLRAYAGGAMPLPIMAASVALWRDDAHVAATRALYNAKFDLADRLFALTPGYRRPAGGFFLWLDVGHGETVTRQLWRERGIKVLPGAYLARPDGNGVNPGDPYIRVALVHDLATTERALRAIADLLAMPDRRQAVGA